MIFLVLILLLSLDSKYTSSLHFAIFDRSPKVSVPHNNWIAPIRPARFQRPLFQSPRLTILGLPASPIPLLLRPPRQRALLLQTYGNIGCRLDFETVHCLVLTFSGSIVPRARRHPGPPVFRCPWVSAVSTVHLGQWPIRRSKLDRGLVKPPAMPSVHRQR